MSGVNKEYKHITDKYKAIINQTYPEMKNLSDVEYYKISNDIVSNLNEPKKAQEIAKQLYDKLLSALNYLALVYAKSGLDEKYFLDSVSECYIRCINKFDEKILGRVDKFGKIISRSKWFKDFNSYKAELTNIAETVVNDIKLQHATSIIVKRTQIKSGKETHQILKHKTQNLHSNQDIITVERVSFDYLDEDLPEHSHDIMEEVFKDALNSIIHKTVRTLSPRECRVLTLYFGLDGGKPMSLRQIAKRYNITGEAVGQTLKKALLKMHHPIRAAKIEDFAY